MDIIDNLDNQYDTQVGEEELDGSSSSTKDFEVENEVLHKEIERLKEKLQDKENEYLRVYAEWNTYKKRVEEQREQDKAIANEQLVMSMLPVLDDFERSVQYAECNGEQNLLDGVKAIYCKLVDVLNSNGVEILSPEPGEEFNVNEQQAVSVVDDLSMNVAECIAETVQKGYKMGNKVIRPASVVVAENKELC